jgi:acyl-CoA hydrolase
MLPCFRKVGLKYFIFLYRKSRPKITSVGHINFRKSVEVGGIALFKSQVCYTIDTFLQVSVETHVLDVETQESEVRTVNTI